MALLGGIHSTIGPMAGAVLLGIASEWLKLKIPYGHLVVYGIIISPGHPVHAPGLGRAGQEIAWPGGES